MLYFHVAESLFLIYLHWSGTLKAKNWIANVYKKLNSLRAILPKKGQKNSQIHLRTLLKVFIFHKAYTFSMQVKKKRIFNNGHDDHLIILFSINLQGHISP